MQKTIFYIMGVSGCGKSTVGKLLAKALDCVFYDGDDYHQEASVKKMAAGQPLNDMDRKEWLVRLNELGKEHIATGAVIACSALKASYRTVLKSEIEEQAVFVFLEGSYADIKARLQARKDHFMPPALLQSQFDTLEKPTKAIAVSILQTPEAIVAKIIAALQN